MLEHWGPVGLTLKGADRANENFGGTRSLRRDFTVVHTFGVLQLVHSVQTWFWCIRLCFASLLHWLTEWLIAWLIAGRRRLCAMLLFYCGGWQMLFIVHLSIYFKSSSKSRRARLEHIILYICCFMYDILLLYVTVNGCVCFFVVHCF